MTINKEFKCHFCDMSDFKVENGYYVCQICGNRTSTGEETKKEIERVERKNKTNQAILAKKFNNFII